MPSSKCPLCGQNLPTEVESNSLEKKLAELASPLLLAQTERIQQLRAGERARHEAEIASLQGKLEQLTRRLEKQPNDRRGREGEFELMAALRQAFPQDRFKAAKPGEKAADVSHFVIENGRELGLLIYENKNVASWRAEYLEQLKRYRLQHKTTFAMLVSTTLPGNRVGISNCDGVLIVEPRFAVPLARVLRDAVVRVGELECSTVDRESKANELMQYLSGHDFQNKFRDLLDAADDLSSQQQRDRTYHENSWEKQRKALTRIQNSHRSISVTLENVLQGATRHNSNDNAQDERPFDSTDGMKQRWWQRFVD